MIKNITYFNKAALFVLLLGFFANNSIAQELKLKDFNHLEGNTSARIYKETDVNGQSCAIIIIKHNFGDSEFEIETGKDYEKRINKTGETWIWVSPDEYQIVIRRKGYLPFKFDDLKNKLIGLETYELIITNEYGRITVNAPDAQIWLDNKSIAKNYYLGKLKKGKYNFRATRDNYYEEQKFVILNPGDSINLKFILKPKMGNLLINSSPSETIGAQIYINNELSHFNTPANIPLLVGEYSTRIEKEGFLPYSEKLTISENENLQLNITLVNDLSIIALKHKKGRNIWLASTVVSAGVGTYSTIRSNTLYEEYQNAGSEASDIRKQIETLDIITPVAYSIAAICLTGVIIKSVKYRKAEKNISLNTYPLKNGVLFSMLYQF